MTKLVSGEFGGASFTYGGLLGGLLGALALGGCSDDGTGDDTTTLTSTLTSTQPPTSTPTVGSDPDTTVDPGTMGTQGEASLDTTASSSDTTADTTTSPGTLTTGSTGTTASSVDPDSTVGPDDTGSTSTGSSGTTVGPDDTSTGGTTDTTADETTEEPLMLHCSADLKDVLDQMNQVFEHCPPDEGCFNGQCVPACQAAASIKGTIGCDFWAPTPPFVFNGNAAASQNGPCHAVFLANTWDKPAQITIQRGGQSYDANTYARIPSGIAPNTTYSPLPPEGLPPDEVAILFLAHKPGSNNGGPLTCPFPPAVAQDTAVSATGKGLAFRVVTDVPVRAYDILPYGGAASFLPSATLLFPSPSWGTNFIAAAPALGAFQDGRFALVVAKEDNTTIKLGPKTDFPGGPGVAPAPANVTTEYVLNAGESIQWSGQNNPMDPTAAVLDSDKPIGLWTGNKYMKIGSATAPGGGGGDSSHQQIPHVKALGREYVGGGFLTRLLNNAPESVPYRMVGAVDGTMLTWDPKPNAALPDVINAGQIVDFETTQVFVVRAQDDDHPFVFTQYMSGTNVNGGMKPGCTNAFNCLIGDEEWVNLLAPQQFQRRYVFFTDPTYPTTNVALIRVKGEDNTFKDVTIECRGVVTGWQPVGGGGTYEYAHVELSRGGVPANGSSCDTSRHLAFSEYTFGIVVWGIDHASSYGYPGGGDIGTINDVFVPVPQ